MNRLYFGDNLKWLSDRKEFPDASVDLVYLDPPFNSNADYNVLFRETSGEVSQAQFHAFTDTWSWAHAAEDRGTIPATLGRPSDQSLFTEDRLHMLQQQCCDSTGQLF